MNSLHNDLINKKGITVGYQRTTRTTTEVTGNVELCAVIIDSSVEIMAPQPFVISASTEDDTASMN